MSPSTGPIPENISVDRQAAVMEVTWEGGRTARFPLLQLRRICPCATCAEERGENPHPKILEAPAELKPKRLGLPLLGDVKKFQITGMHHVGRYALGVTWADGHQSIFAWAFLAERADSSTA